MIRLISSNVVRFIVLVLLQGLVLSNINMGNMVNPYLYVMIFIMLPVEVPHWALLLIGTAAGLGVDAFSNTLGMHMSASIFICFCRPYILKLVSPRDGYDFGDSLHLQRMGFVWFLSYAGLMVLLHHLWLFSIEELNIAALLDILLRTALSGIFTLTLIILSQYLTFKQKAAS